ncbi:hypothetical protein BJ508DRAFT_308292 [Ascobolus immersus RN42]|uniref:Uncharacterized protein n=1 Tax=Ascobolus immersus RN42 TaxID=1160509 RepID=A0A3N4I0N4_ASCIM|nr:hypothetical protein BJ508DRAFT_308292 [Ascobolus immersus RN42]
MPFLFPSLFLLSFCFLLYFERPGRHRLAALSPRSTDSQSHRFNGRLSTTFSTSCLQNPYRSCPQLCGSANDRRDHYDFLLLESLDPLSKARAEEAGKVLALRGQSVPRLEPTKFYRKSCAVLQLLPLLLLERPDGEPLAFPGPRGARPRKHQPSETRDERPALREWVSSLLLFSTIKTSMTAALGTSSINLDGREPNGFDEHHLGATARDNWWWLYRLIIQFARQPPAHSLSCGICFGGPSLT